MSTWQVSGKGSAKGPKKPSAAERTADMFTGRTSQEGSLPSLASPADAADVVKPVADSLEERADRYRAQAFEGQEWTSTLFGNYPVDASLDVSTKAPSSEGAHTVEQAKDHRSEWRLSSKNGWLYLEQLRLGRGNTCAYHYAGVMFPESEVMKLADVIVQAARAYRAKQ
jgi:hypothetical protein